MIFIILYLSIIKPKHIDVTEIFMDYVVMLPNIIYNLFL